MQPVRRYKPLSFAQPNQYLKLSQHTSDCAVTVPRVITSSLCETEIPPSSHPECRREVEH